MNEIHTPTTHPADAAGASVAPYYALAALSAGAGFVHVAMIPAHVADSTVMGVAFAAAAWF